MTRNVRILPRPKEVTEVAAEVIADLSQRAIHERGRFTIAFSGGSTPRDLYRLLARSPYPETIDWQHVVVFWGDERCVPPEDEASCYRLAYDSLLAHVPIRAAHIHRMPGEMEPVQAAELYESTLRREFGGSWPRLDLILLGMGDDGHTASLFPHTPILAETRRWVAATYVPSNAYPHRITLTAPAINAAATVLLLVTGVTKASTAQRVLEGPASPHELPVQMIQPVDGEAIWLLDTAAAGKLQRT